MADAHSRRVIGWAMGEHLRTELTLDALAMAESFFATRKAALDDAGNWPTRAAARTTIFAWIAVWYNRQRRHSARGYRAPVTHEARHLLLLQDLAA